MKKLLICLVCLLLAVSTAISMVSCIQQVKAEELSAGYSRKIVDAADISPDFRPASAEFAFDMLRNLPVKEGENVLYSPLSAIACLGMITGGADGETLRQLEAAFGMDEETLTESLYGYVSRLYTSEDCTFKMANSIWTKDTDGRYHVSEEFLQKNADYYGAQIYRAPFDDGTKNAINGWVKDNTDGMIKKIINRLNPDTVMILINALVFDAEWQTEYEDYQIREYIFTDYAGAESKVDMMNSSESRYIELDGAVGFAKNYKGGKYSFAALLPEEGVDVYDFLNSISGEDFIDMWDSMSYRPISARIPEFSYDCHYDLNETLEALGVTDMFSEKDADFSRLGTYDGGNIYCSSVQQKTHIEVNRHGTRAAAVTWGMMDATSAAPAEDPISIYLDRPFVYAIVDNETGLPMFVGAVVTVK